MTRETLKYCGNNVCYVKYNSTAEFVERAFAYSPPKWWRESSVRTRDDLDSSFYGVDSFNESYKDYVNGDTKNNSSVCNLSVELDKYLEDKEAKTHVQKFTNQCGSLNMNRFRQGNDFCLQQRKRFRGERKMLNLYVSFSASCMVSTGAIKNRGAVVLSLIKALRERYFINLHLIDYCKFNEKDHFDDSGTKLLMIDVEMSENKLNDVNAISFATTRPDFLRVFGFANKEFIAKSPSRMKEDAFGHLDGFNKDVIEGLKLTEEKRIVMPDMYSNDGYRTLKESARTLTRILADQLAA